MKPGPTPLPTATLKLRGSRHARGRQHDPTSVPMLKADPPAWLTDAAKAKMVELHETLHKAGVITEHDRDALILYCETWSQFQAAAEHIKQHGQTMPVHDKDGNVTKHVQRPQTRIIKDLLGVLLRYQQEFGMTPSSRSRVATITPTADPTNPMLTLS